MAQGLSVILPAFNEQESLRLAVTRVMATLDDLVDDFELIVVDDGSTDRTGELTVELLEEHPARLRVLRHVRNRGYGAAIRSGFEAAVMELVFYTDADNQFDVSDLAHFLPLIKEYDVVVGFRVYRYDTVVRSMLSWIYNLIVRILFRVKVRDVDCAFKLFRREVIEAITIETDDFFVDAELVAKARRWNFRLLEKGVRHYPRQAGETTVRASHIPETLRRIAVMWWRIYVPSRSRMDAMARHRASSDPDVIEVTPRGSTVT